MADVVLVVAADSGFAQGMERSLRAQGLECVLADEAETAMVALDYEKPAAVVLENDLPDRPGLEVAREMRESEAGAGVPIVLLAGPMMPASELTPRAVDAGVTVCVDVSTDRGSLAHAVAALLGGDSGPFERIVNGEPLGTEAPTHAEDLEKTDAPGDPEAETPRPKEESVEERLDRLEAKTSRLDSGSPPPAERLEAPAPVSPSIQARAKADASAPAAGTARTGNLREIGFGPLLATLHKERATGVLELVREKVKKTIWLREGIPVHSRSNAMGETLGAVLVKMGKITEAQRAQSIEISQRDKRLHGDVLVELAMIRQKDVTSALQAQARAKVINCFAWDDGSYDFKPDLASPSGQPEIKMTFGALIASGVKQRFDLPRMRKVLLPHIGETPRFVPSTLATAEELKLSPEELEMVKGLQGRRSLAEVLALSDMDEEALHRLLVTAHFAGVLSFHAEGPVTARLRMDREEEAEAAAEKSFAEISRTEPGGRLAATDQTAVAEDEGVEFTGSLFDDATAPPAEKLPEEEDGDDPTGPPGPAARKDSRMDVSADAIGDATDEANAILNAEHQFLKGERLLEAGNLAKALEAFKAAVELYPKESEYKACYGWALFKLSHPADPAKADEGERIITEALAVNPRNDKAHYFLGAIAKAKGDPERAVAELEKALELQPENVDAQRELRALDIEEKKGGISGLFRTKK